jgi:hypothetical protein
MAALQRSVDVRFFAVAKKEATAGYLVAKNCAVASSSAGIPAPNPGKGNKIKTKQKANRKLVNFSPLDDLMQNPLSVFE